MLTEESTSRFVQLGPHKVHYNEAGQGEALIFGVGYAPGQSAWAVYRKVLGALSQHFRCILIDPLNSHKSDAHVIKGEARSTVYARTMIDTMNALGIDKASIVDMSFGAQTGQLLAIHHPARVNKLVLHACTMRVPAVFYTTPIDAHAALGAAFANPTLETLRGMMNSFLYDGPSYSDEELSLREGLALWLSRPELDAARKASDNPRLDINDQLGKIKAPCLLIRGRDDRILGGPEGGLFLLNYLRDARLVIFNKCGHWAPFERPGEFARLVIDFVKHTEPLRS